MGPYFPLLQVDVAHGYYADGRCRGLRFVPAGTTAERLRRADALVRADGGSLRIHGPSEAVERLRADAEDASGAFDDRAALSWCVFATDDDFACGTEDAADRPRELLWVEPRDASASDSDSDSDSDADSDSNSTASPAPGEARPVALAARPRALASPELDPLLTPHDRRVIPFALLRLPLSRLPVRGPARDPGAWPVRCRWPLAPRATVWKYCLLGDWSEPALAVVDLAGRTGFTAPARERLDDGTPMLAIRSLQRVPLAQRPAHRFQLRSAGANDKVLIRRLPTAAAQLLARETIAGQPAIVSEIHVHR